MRVEASPCMRWRSRVAETGFVEKCAHRRDALGALRERGHSR